MRRRARPESGWNRGGRYIDDLMDGPVDDVTKENNHYNSVCGDRRRGCELADCAISPITIVMRSLIVRLFGDRGDLCGKVLRPVKYQAELRAE